MKFQFPSQKFWCWAGKKKKTTNRELFRPSFFLPVRKKSQKPNLSSVTVSRLPIMHPKSRTFFFLKKKSFKKLFCVLKLIDASQMETIWWFRPVLDGEMLVSWYTELNFCTLIWFRPEHPYLKNVFIKGVFRPSYTHWAKPLTRAWALSTSFTENWTDSLNTSAVLWVFQVLKGTLEWC